MATATHPHESDENIGKSVGLPVHHHHHGISLIPRPSQDVRDPLRWPRWLKIVALIVTSMTNFTANFIGAGLSVATPILQQQFRKSATTVNTLLTFHFLFLAIGNLLWVPLGAKIGKRPALLLAYGSLIPIMIWSAEATSFKSLLAARSFAGLVSSAGESIVPGIVGDIFFLHEHAAALSAYTILITTATAIGPILASFIVKYDSHTWRTFNWVGTGLAAATFIALFVFYPESNFERPLDVVPGERVVIQTEAGGHTLDTEKHGPTHQEDIMEGVWDVDVVPKPLTSIWLKTWTVNQSVSLGRAFLRPIILAFCPDVMLAVYVFGVSLSAQVILIFAFPSFLMAPPYLWGSIGVGLIEIAAIIGFLFGCLFGGWVADKITARIIIKHDGEIYPAQRLLAAMPLFWMTPVGCILVACACADKLHWVAIAFGFGMLSFGTAYAPNILVTFVLESHPELMPESLVSINVFKNMCTFLFTYVATDWIKSSGWMQVYMIFFMLSTLSIVFTVVAYKFHKGITAVNRRIYRFMV